MLISGTCCSGGVVVVMLLCTASECFRISMKRESAVSKEVLAALSSGTGKKFTKAEKDERYGVVHIQYSRSHHEDS